MAAQLQPRGLSLSRRLVHVHQRMQLVPPGAPRRQPPARPCTTSCAAPPTSAPPPQPRENAPIARRWRAARPMLPSRLAAVRSAREPRRVRPLAPPAAADIPLCHGLAEHTNWPEFMGKFDSAAAAGCPSCRQPLTTPRPTAALCK